MKLISESTLSELPQFSDIKIDDIVESVKQAIEACKKTIINALKHDSYNWDNLVTAIDETNDELSRLWSPVSHMNSVVSNDQLREAHDACLPLLSDYGTWVGQHKGLFDAYQQIKQSPVFAKLTAAQRKVIDNGIRDFTLSGVIGK